MADDVNGDSEFFDISTLSDAEKRRLRRRQRILDNQGARLQRILNNDSGNNENGDDKLQADGSALSESLTDSSVTKSATKRGDSADSFCLGDAENIRNRINKTSSKPLNSSHNHSSSNGPEAIPSIPASLLKELSGLAAQNNTTQEKEQPQPVTIGVQSDGTVILPKLSEIYGRVLICLLAMFLSIFNAKRYLVTFIAWEIAYYFMNGLPPMPPPNMAMVLAAVMGFNEIQLNRIKRILHFSNCVMIDFSLFLTFSLIPHVIRDVISLL